MISKEKKTAIMQEYARSEGDTGSPEVQIAVLRSSFQTRPSEDGWTETWPSGIPEKNRY